MALIDKETIRKEINKRYAEYRAKMRTDNFIYYAGMADALGLFKQFLDSLLEQPVTDCHELDNHTIMEEIRKCGCNPNEFDVARHFFELGLNARMEKSK